MLNPLLVQLSGRMLWGFAEMSKSLLTFASELGSDRIPRQSKVGAWRLVLRLKGLRLRRFIRVKFTHQNCAAVRHSSSSTVGI